MLLCRSIITICILILVFDVVAAWPESKFGINKLFGHVNDKNITSIVLESETNQEKMEYTLDSDRMFIFC